MTTRIVLIHAVAVAIEPVREAFARVLAGGRMLQHPR